MKDKKAIYIGFSLLFLPFFFCGAATQVADDIGEDAVWTKAAIPRLSCRKKSMPRARSFFF